MKEHAGGTPDVGHIPLDSWEAESFVVPVVEFDYAAVDDPVSYFLEAIDGGAGQDHLKALFFALVQRFAARDRAASIAMLLGLLRKAEKPRMLADQIVWATAMDAGEGNGGCAEYAKSYGVSKQTFVQGAHRLCDKLGLKPCRYMRDEKARETMSKSNYRRANAAATNSN